MIDFTVLWGSIETIILTFLRGKFTNNLVLIEAVDRVNDHIHDINGTIAVKSSVPLILDRPFLVIKHDNYFSVRKLFT